MVYIICYKISQAKVIWISHIEYAIDTLIQGEKSWADTGVVKSNLILSGNFVVQGGFCVLVAFFFCILICW